MESRLPESYLERMKDMLGNEFQAYLESFGKAAQSGLRINRLKLSVEDYKKISKYELTPVPWIDNGCYVSANEQPAKHPHYYAGLYYLQEPSAMTPANVLPVVPGDRVLDMCAAPGGKSTELASRLQGKGVLVANDISNSRAKALLKNLELFGARNALITSEPPVKLLDYFTGFFDKILVDAPCSGEGMFRKSPAIIKNWEQYGTGYYNDIQKEILPLAIKMLRPGGMLLYSTCTFSKEENEGTLSYLLERYPGLHVVKIPKYIRENGDYVIPEGFAPARPEWGNGNPEIANAVRLYPHRINGEGHFTALLQLSEDSGGPCASESGSFVKPAKLSAETAEFLDSIGLKVNRNRLIVKDERLYELPDFIGELKGLRTLRSGLLIGEIKKNRFEPSQALAMALKADEFPNVYNMSSDDENVIRYLKCETINVPPEVKDGWVLICTDGYPLGFGKASKGVLKNKYLPGWRWM